MAGVHLAGLILAGIGSATVLAWAAQHRLRLVAAGLGLMLLVAPAYIERAAYLDRNAGLMLDSAAAYGAERADVDALVETLETLPPGRVYAGFASNWGRTYTIGAVPMYAILQQRGLDMLGYLYHAESLNSDVQVLFDERRPEQYALFNVRYLVVPRDEPLPVFARPLGDYGRHRLAVIDAAGGYLGLASSALVLRGTKEGWFPAAAAWLASGAPAQGEQPTIYLGLEADTHTEAQPLSAASFPQLAPDLNESSGRVTAETVGFNRYAGAVDLPSAATVALKATYHPGWQATVDGAPVPTRMVMPSYVAVDVPAGTHVVEFTYRAAPSRLPLFGLGVLGLAATAWVERRRARRQPNVNRIRLAPAISGLVRSASDALAGEAPWLACVGALGVLAGLPALQYQELSGHDTLEYLPRNIEFWRALTDGQLIPRWAADLDGGYGQPLFLFNPPLVYYTTALFHALGASFVAAEDLAALALLGAGVFGVYVLCRRPLGRWGGMAAAGAYAFAEPVLVTLYVRHALADFAAVAVLPWTTWGVLRASRGGTRWALLPGAVGTALLLLASNPVAIVAVPGMIGLVIWTAAQGRRLAILSRGLAALGLGAGLAAYFWIPALFERGEVHLERLLDGPLRYDNHFVWPHQLVWSAWGYGVSVPGPNDGMSFALGPVNLAALVLVLVLLAARVRMASLAGPMAALVVLAAYLTTFPAQWLWDALPLLDYLEFPWRELVLCALGTAILCGVVVNLVGRHWPRLTAPTCGIIVVLLLVTEYAHARPERMFMIDEATFAPAQIATRGVFATTADEYQPADITQSPGHPATDPATVVTGQAAVRVLERTSTRLHLDVDAVGPARLMLHLAVFPGWELVVDGHPQPLVESDTEDSLQVDVEGGEHDVWLRFGSTPLRSGSEALAAVTLLLVVVGLPRRWQD